MPRTVDLIHDAVVRHKIAWSDVADRVAKNESLPTREASAQTAALIERRLCSLGVGAAVIELIAGRKE